VASATACRRITRSRRRHRAPDDVACPHVCARSGTTIRAAGCARRRALDQRAGRRRVEREDISARLGEISVPTLVIHGDSDAIVPFEASGKRSHDAIGDSELVLIQDGPHGINASHPQQFNDALLTFLGR